MRAFIGYVKARLEERATWAAFGVGITAAAAVAWPWNVALVSAAAIGALVPTSKADAP